MNDVEWAVDYLLRHGMHEITPEQRESPEFKQSLDNTRKLVRQHEATEKRRLARAKKRG
jgi:hypothetical protein